MLSSMLRTLNKLNEQRAAEIKLREQEEAQMFSVTSRIEALRACVAAGAHDGNSDMLIRSQDKMRYLSQEITDARAERPSLEEIEGRIKQLELLIDIARDECSASTRNGFSASGVDEVYKEIYG